MTPSSPLSSRGTTASCEVKASLIIDSIYGMRTAAWCSVAANRIYLAVLSVATPTRDGRELVARDDELEAAIRAVPGIKEFYLRRIHSFLQTMEKADDWLDRRYVSEGWVLLGSKLRLKDYIEKRTKLVCSQSANHTNFYHTK